MHYVNEKEQASLFKAELKVRALKSPLRQRILKVIKENNNRLCVTDIYEKLNMKQPVASRLLRVLHEAKLVDSQRMGKTIFYSVNDANIRELLDCCEKLSS